MAERLDDEAVTRGLEAAPGWAGDSGQITLEIRRDDFIGAMGVVTEVAMIAEKAFHHPDIHISWNTVTLELSSHEAGGVTDQCIDLARQISERLGTR